MHIVFWIIFGAVLVAGLFFYGRCQLLDERIIDLENKLHEAKRLKHRTEIMMIKDCVDSWKAGENAFTVMPKISNIINETALESDQTN